MKRAVEELRERENAREAILTHSHRARMLSKQAILLIHNNAFVDAKAKIDEAKRLMEELDQHLLEHVEFHDYEEVHAAGEEYAEAAILYELRSSSSFPLPELLGVSPQTYLLGIGDVVGELKREAMDSLRLGDIEAAENDLRLMEDIYLSLLSMEEASLLLKGLRRKLDIARSVIESTRGELTTETGRRRLIESIRELIGKIDEK